MAKSWPRDTKGYHEILTRGDDRIDPIIWEKGVSFKDCLEGLLLCIIFVI